jgi:diaminohydroxyphosphoribosylaminopyrimidine deaminase/5-amino-6-(5-phosphoribosylamino)uracil reductase
LGVTLKLATSLDGRIATASGESRWITGPEAREAVHRLRAEHDAVVIGIGTALADDPELSVRLEGYQGPQPARVVLDSRQRLPASSRLASAEVAAPTYVVTTEEPAQALLSVGVRLLRVPAGEDGRADLGLVVQALAVEGLRRLFVEGGGQVAASFLRAGLVDRIEWFRAPIVLGAEGRPAVGDLGVRALAEAPRLRRLSVESVGEDLWERYERA